MPLDEHSLQPASCNNRYECDSGSKDACDDTMADMLFLLPLSLVGLARVADGTTYHDAIHYLIPPVLVEMLVKHEIGEWESMEFETILGKILLLKHKAQERSVIPIQSLNHTREEALLRYLRRAREKQFKSCIREHRKLRKMDDELAELSHKLGKTHHDGGEMLESENEDQITFIDDERASSSGESVSHRHSQRARA